MTAPSTVAAGASLGALSLLVACGSAPVTAGFEEPIRASSAQFIEGTLPGLPPLTIEEIQAGEMEVTPRVPAASFGGGSTVKIGEGSRSISGAVSGDSAAIGMRFESLGSGYWLKPVGAFDTQTGGYAWSMTVDLSSEAPTGIHRLLFAAVGSDGRAGTQKAIDLCLSPRIPDKALGLDPAIKGNACDPTREPPALVLSLGWDANVDLDLQVVTPSGKRVDAKHPTTAVGTSGMKPDPSEPGTGILDRDSNADCQIDGLNLENLVFQEPPPAGIYAVYVDLYEACGEAAVRFTASLHQREDGAEPGTYRQVETFRQSGELTAAQADGGSRSGLFVTEFEVN